MSEVWSDPRTWISIISAFIGISGFLFGILSFYWNRKENRLEVLSKPLQAFIRCAQHLQRANSARKNCESIKAAFPKMDNDSDAAQYFNMHLSQYSEHIKKSEEELRNGESEFHSRSFRFPDNIGKLVEGLGRILVDAGGHVNSGRFDQAEMAIAQFNDSYRQVVSIGRGWRLLDPLEGIKKKIRGQKKLADNPKIEFDISDSSMKKLTNLIHKRATTHSRNTFSVMPPKIVLNEPGCVSSIDVVAKLKNEPFNVVFQDGDSMLMALHELVFFVYNLIFLSHQMKEISEMAKVNPNAPFEASVKVRISIDELMRPEMVKLLLSKIEFSTTACN